MSDAYTDADRERLAPKAKQVMDAMLGQGYMTFEQVSRKTGIKEGTVASRFRELIDREHSYLGLDGERRSIGKGLHEYRLFIRQPEQLTLLEEARL